MSNHTHILTNETLLHDAPVINRECSICTIISDLRIGWTGEHCDVCGTTFNMEEGFWGDIVKRRREILSLSRKQMGELTGYKGSSVKRYEWVRCSKPYFEKTTE